MSVEMISTKQLANRTGYSVNYICELVRDGKLKPIGRINRGHAFSPDVLDLLVPKPDSGRRKANDPIINAKHKTYRICGFCKHYGSICAKTGKRSAYNRVVCDDYDQNPEAIERAVNPPANPPSEIKTYHIEVTPMVKAKSPVTDEVKETVLEESKELVLPERERKPITKKSDVIAILTHDLELAQQAMALIDTVRQVWGDVEPVRDAILQEYARRRVQ
jgi:hypothetical protein